MSESAPLAIIGISCLFPKADDLQSYWRNIKNGVDAITPIPMSHWNVADYFDADPKAPDRTYAQRGGFISPVAFNPMEFGMAPKDVEATDTTQLLGMMAARQALVDAGYGEKPYNKERISVVLGVTGALELVIPLGARLGHPIWRRALKEAGVSESVSADVVQRISDGYVGWQENSFPGLLGNVAAGRIANRLDLGGTNCVVDAACASSLAALHLAAMELETGRADMVVTGGIDTFNDIFMYMCFSKTPALSPSGDAKPFDRSCDGTILGEGLGMVILKRLADAERDKDHIYAVLKGIGSSSDGHGGAIYAPQTGGQQQALRRAYALAGVTPDTVELVEAHGTGTKVGDATEIKSLNEVFRPAQSEGSWVALGSVKSQIGHAKAAAGVAGLIKAALALDHKVLPPTIKVSQPVDELAPGRSPFYVNTQKRPWLPRPEHPRRAGVSAFGFGGTNFHCVLEEHGSQMNKPGWDGDVEIFAFSGSRIEDIRSQVSGVPSEGSWLELRRQARDSRNRFQGRDRFRLLFPASKGAPIAPVRDAILTMLDKHPEKTGWSLPNGAAFGSGERSGKLGALFPGQGSQYVGMFRDLACQFPAMLESLAAADRVFATVRPECGRQRLSDFIYPHPAFSDSARAEQEEALKSTDIAQPALGAAGLGAMNVLASFGITPEAAAGHSYGELLALCGAGRFETESLHLLSNVRGRLMAADNGGDRGAMLAAQATEDVVTRFVKEENLELVVANRNSPSQFVLAGPTLQIEQAAGKLAKRSVRARVLKVSAAFHSTLVADAREPFAAVLENVPFSLGRIPVYANSTAKAYPTEAKQARELLANQIVRPVDFMAQIETMYADGVTTFVEMGPGHVLSDLVQAILHGKEVDAIALDASRGSRSGLFDLAVTLCRVAALGHPVELKRWEEAPPAAPAATNGRPVLTISLTGANHRNSSPRRAPVSAPAAPAVQSNGNGHPASVPRPASPAVPALPKTSIPAPLSVPVASAVAPVLDAGKSAALQAAQQGMLTLQKLQEETARLHRQFLENQDAARRTLETLLLQRRELLGLPSARFAAMPAPAVQAPAASAPAVLAPVPQAPVPSTSPEPKPTPAVQTLSVSAAVTQTVLEVVAEKTGYPAEMLTLDMGLDADLGIDSIKRVEIMAALRGRLPASPEIKPEHLGALQTLRQVADFLSQGSSVNGAPALVSTPVSISSPVASRAAGVVLNVVAEKTGYPVEMLNLDMGLDADLGVDSIKRVEIMAGIRAQLPDAPEIKPEHLGALQSLRQVVEFLSPGASAAPVLELVATPISAAQSANPVLSSKVTTASGAADVVLNVVAEKTGYPVEMLNLDMGLDADLGVDSIKRVEIMAGIRAQLPDAPEIKPEHLGALQSLRQVVEFLSPGAPEVAVKASVGEQPAPQSSGSEAVSAAVLAVVAEKTGYPPEMLNLGMGLDADLGIDSIKRVEIMAALRVLLPGSPEIKPEHLGSLQTLQQVVDFLSASPAAARPAETPVAAAPATREPAPELHRQIVRPIPLAQAGSRPVLTLPEGSVIWLTDDGSGLSKGVEARLKKRGCVVAKGSPEFLIARADAESPAALVILWPHTGGGDAELKALFRLIQTAGPSLRKNKGILLTTSRLDGVFGFGSLNGNGNPVSGGLAGLTKTARHEWPEVHCKALDLNPERPLAAETADWIVDEMFHCGPVEVGISDGARFVLHVETLPRAEGDGRKILNSNDVIVVTGGARGITATTVQHLAGQYGGCWVLLGRSKLTEAEPEWLVGLHQEADIKKALMSRANGSGTPKKIEAAYRDAMAQREVRECVRQIQSTGARAVYRAMDVRNASQVQQTLASIRSEFGPIRGLIHGAGVLADRRIEDKTAEQFDLVYGTKVDGLRNLLTAVAGDDLKVIALFSSYTGRFGRTGQVDYAAANEVLNKLAQSESRRRKNCRVVSFNWGPWNGGMVSEGLRKLFESEGVGLIDPRAGAEFFARELIAPAPAPVEVLALAVVPHSGGVADAGALSVALEREVSVKSLPCLESHVLNGRAVLPTALMIEWLAHGAVHANPGMLFHGLENFKVLKGLVLEKQGASPVSVLTGVGRARDGLFVVPVQLVSHAGEKQVVHARGDVLLADALPAAPLIQLPPAINGNGHSRFSYADGRLFHGAHFHGIETVESCSENEISGLVKSAPTPKHWVKHPLRPAWLSDPLALDSSFQLMILWSWQNRDAASLPCAIRRFRQFARSFPKEGTRVVIQIESAETALVAASLRFFDRHGALLALAEGYECVIDKGLRDAFRQNRLPHEG